MTQTRKQISVGGVLVGGGAPVSVQSMTTTKPSDISATVAEIHRLEAAGCEVVRLAVPDVASARAFEDIRKHVTIPLVADIHFDHTLALESIAAGAQKIRINPGNIGSDDGVRAVVAACRAKNIPIRIGVNGGSLPRHIIAAHGHGAKALVACVLEHVALLNRYDFDDICISAKSSSVADTVAAYRMLFAETSYPLHIGLTEAGTTYAGTMKSAIAIGALLLDGIGDTIRVSLTDDPTEEIRAGRAILQSIGIRRFSPEIIACPTCGRCNVDLIALAHEVESRLATSTREITVAVMGCAVNGPGEARTADYGIACGMDEGVLFRRGEVVGKVSQEKLVDALMEFIDHE